MSEKPKPPMSPNLKPFLPGQSGNPSGRPKVDPEIKKLRDLTKEQFKEIAEFIIQGDATTLREYKTRPGVTVLQQWIASVAITAIQRGDMASLDKLLDRLIGKVKEQVDLKVFRPTVVERLNGTTVEFTSEQEDDSGD